MSLSLPQPVLTTLDWFKKTEGRDKLYRFVQYFTKFVVQTLKSQGADKDVIDRLTKGASAVGLTRKLLRFFRAVEYTQEFLKAFSIKDDFERTASIAKSTSFTIWMICDHIQWLNKVGYLKLGATPKIDELHSKGWLIGLLIGLVLSGLKFRSASLALADARAEQRYAANAGAADQLREANKAAAEASKAQSKVVLSLVKGSFDAMIPAARLGYLPISDGTVGIAGAITSAIGAYDTWPAQKK